MGMVDERRLKNWKGPLRTAPHRHSSIEYNRFATQLSIATLGHRRVVLVISFDVTQKGSMMIVDDNRPLPPGCTTMPNDSKVD